MLIHIIEDPYSPLWYLAVGQSVRFVFGLYRIYGVPLPHIENETFTADITLCKIVF